MDRRGFLAGGAALASLGAPAWAQSEGLREAAREAWLYALPLVVSAQLRKRAIGAAPGPSTPGFGAFVHDRDPQARALQISAPEPHVLYSSAWIDLSAGPARLFVPPTGGRYFCLTLLDMYGQPITAVDSAEAGRTGRGLSIIGPAHRMGVGQYTAPMPRLPPLHREVKARSDWIWALARTRVAGEDDLPGAHALQDSLELHAKARPVVPAAPCALDAPWNDYFYTAQRLIEENPPPRGDVAFFRRIAALQLGPAGGFERARFADVEIPEVVAGVAEARRLVADAAAPATPGGWLAPQRPDAPLDLLGRAEQALATPGDAPQTAIAAWRAAAPDRSLTFAPGSAWRLTLEPAMQASAFWSLSAYEATADGRLATPSSWRWSISADMPQLRVNEDGAVDIRIGPEDGETGDANWLPTPEDGRYALVLRAYAPPSSVVRGRYRQSALEPVVSRPRRRARWSAASERRVRTRRD